MTTHSRFHFIVFYFFIWMLVNQLYISTPDILGKYWDTLCQSSIQKYLVVFQYWYFLSFSLCFVIFIPFPCQRWNTFKSATSSLLRCGACYVGLPAKCYCHICLIVKHTIWPFTTLALFLHFLKLEAKIEKTGERTKSVVFDARYLISLTAAGTWQNETTNENSCVSCGKYLGL